MRRIPRTKQPLRKPLVLCTLLIILATLGVLYFRYTLPRQESNTLPADQTTSPPSNDVDTRPKVTTDPLPSNAPEPTPELLITDLQITNRGSALSYTAAIQGAKANAKCSILLVSGNDRIESSVNSSPEGCSGEIINGLFAPLSTWTVSLTYKVGQPEATLKKVIVIQ